LYPSDKEYHVPAEYYDPEGCYNVYCEMAAKEDGGADFIKVLSTGNTPEHDCWDVPYVWDFSERECKTVGDDCEHAYIKIQALNNIGRGLECDVKVITFECDDEPTPAPTPCPEEHYYPEISKCEMKDGEIELKFKEKGSRLPDDVGLEFKTHDGRTWYYNGKDGHHSEEKYWTANVHDLDEALVDKKTEQHFYLHFYTSDECYSPHSVKCKNKNLTPIGLDLDGSGEVETIRGEFHIDLTGDHFPETLDTWFAPTEGILINTLYGLENGVNGEHLFGDMGGAFDNGFAKLAVLDANDDGLVSGKELTKLAVWRDANSNAVLDEGEMKSLEFYGIVSLSVNPTHLRSSALLEDGSVMLMEDLYFTRTEREAIA